MKKLIAYRLYKNAHPLLIDKLRRLYNESLLMLSTKPLAPKTPREQQWWWDSLDFEKVTVHLYSLLSNPWGDVVAFSMVTNRGDHCTPMFAIDPAYWGMGLGISVVTNVHDLRGVIGLDAG